MENLKIIAHENNVVVDIDEHRLGVATPASFVFWEDDARLAILNKNHPMKASRDMITAEQNGFVGQPAPAGVRAMPRAYRIEIAYGQTLFVIEKLGPHVVINGIYVCDSQTNNEDVIAFSREGILINCASATPNLGGQGWWDDVVKDEAAPMFFIPRVVKKIRRILYLSIANGSAHIKNQENAYVMAKDSQVIFGTGGKMQTLRLHALTSGVFGLADVDILVLSGQDSNIAGFHVERMVVNNGLTPDCKVALSAACAHSVDKMKCSIALTTGERSLLPSMDAVVEAGGCMFDKDYAGPVMGEFKAISESIKAKVGTYVSLPGAPKTPEALEDKTAASPPASKKRTRPRIINEPAAAPAPATPPAPVPEGGWHVAPMTDVEVRVMKAEVAKFPMDNGFHRMLVGGIGTALETGDIIEAWSRVLRARGDERVRADAGSLNRINYYLCKISAILEKKPAAWRDAVNAEFDRMSAQALKKAQNPKNKKKLLTNTDVEDMIKAIMPATGADAPQQPPGGLQSAPVSPKSNSDAEKSEEWPGDADNDDLDELTSAESSESFDPDGEDDEDEEEFLPPAKKVKADTPLPSSPAKPAAKPAFKPAAKNTRVVSFKVKKPAAPPAKASSPPAPAQSEASKRPPSSNPPKKRPTTSNLSPAQTGSGGAPKPKPKVKKVVMSDDDALMSEEEEPY